MIRHEYKKPHVYDDILKSYDGEIKADEVCVIGDRILADIVMGNRHGFLTIKTQCFSTENENIFVTLS